MFFIKGKILFQLYFLLKYAPVNLDFCPKIDFGSKCDFAIVISASLLHVYDDSWQVESFPSLIGSNHFSNIKAGTHLEIIEAPSYATEANAEPVGYKPNKKDIAELKRYLTLMGVGYLIPAGTKIQDPKKFTHLCSTIMDKIETRHGTKLKPMVSVLWYALFFRESLTIFSDSSYHRKAESHDFEVCCRQHEGSQCRSRK